MSRFWETNCTNIHQKLYQESEISDVEFILVQKKVQVGSAPSCSLNLENDE
jgi:hypothetical protein